MSHIAPMLLSLLTFVATGCSRSELDEGDRGGQGSRRGPTRNAGEEPDFKQNPNQARADRIDLLFVVDDSGSMEDKQDLLRRALPDMVTRLTRPRCVDRRGNPVGNQPDDAQAPCPDGSAREFNAVQDMHIGVVTSSLGTSGDCMADLGDRRLAHLVPPPDGLGYAGQPFLAWDPGRVKQPPGLSDIDRLNGALSGLLRIGGQGCPDEASLEAFYRFLIDPAPPAGARPVGCPVGSGLDNCIAPNGLDEELLAQRAAFLRPDSLLAIIVLSDESDCSVAPEGDALRFLTDAEPLPRATEVCRSAPDDACCHSCAAEPPAGCPPVTGDPSCRQGRYSTEEDPLLLRCWNQKRRFGIDRSYPISRYVRGLTELIIEDQRGQPRVNPLFSALDDDGTPRRDPSLVFFAAIVGVPWQDLATDPDDGDTLHYLAGDALTEAGVWELVVGDPSTGVEPLDPLMIESVLERAGTHPITGAALAPSSSRQRLQNPINGHEMNLLAMPESTFRNDLQYACIFPLESPRDCADEGAGCDCANNPRSYRKPICQGLDGSYSAVQWAAKAFPGTRQLQLLSALPRNAIAASICARNVRDPVRQDFGYRPALEALVDRLRLGLN